MNELNDNVVSGEAVADPHTFFKRLREKSPIHWSERHHAWIVTRYSDVLTGMGHDKLSTANMKAQEERLSKEKRALFAPAAKLLEAWMIFRDPPEHTKLRSPVSSAFKARSVASLTGMLEERVDELLENMAGKGKCSLIRELAFPLPADAIAILLGVPSDRREDFRTWSRMIGGLVIGKLERDDVWDRALEAEKKFSDLFGSLISRYEQDPEENLISELIRVRNAGEHLDPDQMIGACTLLLFAGHETTANLIASGTLALLKNPAQLERLRADPTLIDSAVEEMLRYDGPSKVTVRRVRDSFLFEGMRFERGQPVFLSTAGANRDPEEFVDPDSFDIGREPNRHLGFGWGRHFCLGAQLARLETKIAITRLISRFPRLELAPQDLAWEPTVLGRALKGLEVLPGDS